METVKSLRDSDPLAKTVSAARTLIDSVLGQGEDPQVCFRGTVVVLNAAGARHVDLGGLPIDVEEAISSLLADRGTLGAAWIEYQTFSPRPSAARVGER